ncbi:MAG: metallopeptidase family protein [Pseudomonadota bacterium]
MAHAAFAALPGPFRHACTGLVIRVVEIADRAQLDGLNIDDPLELTGLYEGIALTERSVADQPLAPDTVWLFRRAILFEWVVRGDVDLTELVTHVLVHEIAHHLGWSDDDIRAVDDWTL